MYNSENIYVSVVVPIYNSSHLLSNLLDSLTVQTYKNFEVLICDDGSTDDLLSIIKNYKNFLHINYFKLKNFGGPAMARNTGIKYSKGSLIAFVDADDWWDKNKLEISISKFDKETDIVFHNLKLMGKESSFFKNKIIKSKNLSLPIFNDLIMNGNTILNSSVVIRKNILIKANGISENKKMIAAEDYNLWLRVSLVTNKFKFINESLGYYYIQDGLSRTRDMSIPTRVAIEEFNNILSNKQKEIIKSRLNYIRAKYNKHIENHSLSLSLFYSSLSLRGNLLKLKSLILILHLYLIIISKFFIKIIYKKNE